MRPIRRLSLLCALLLLAACGQKGKLYLSGEPAPTDAPAPTQPEPTTTDPFEPQPPSDF